MNQFLDDEESELAGLMATSGHQGFVVDGEHDGLRRELQPTGLSRCDVGFVEAEFRELAFGRGCRKTAQRKQQSDKEQDQPTNNSVGC